MSNELYNELTVYGDTYRTKHRLHSARDFVKWSEENFDYVRYNPRKDVNRYGLSITSLDGGLSGRPDLDSIPEYNRENGTSYTERDMDVPTPVYDYHELKPILDPIKQYICRSHVLKLDPGGFFPPHRDYRRGVLDTFRILVPLQNMNPPELTFVVDGRIQHWETGYFYFLNAAKMHYLFNASFAPSYMIVFNIHTEREPIEYFTHNLRYE